jgi:hypothetical protein
MGFQQFGKSPAEFKPHALNIFLVPYLRHFVVPPAKRTLIIKKIHDYCNASHKKRVKCYKEDFGRIFFASQKKPGFPGVPPRAPRAAAFSAPPIPCAAAAQNQLRGIAVRQFPQNQAASICRGKSRNPPLLK